MSAPEEITRLRLEYSEVLLSKLNISMTVIGENKIQHGGQYLILSNHRSIIDPLIVEFAFRDKGIYSLWIAKKELFNSFFFGAFTRNSGSILLDRESSRMGSFFNDIKAAVAQGHSISVFPEGSRNKTDSPLAEFKKGTQVIAAKNKLQMLPVFIRGNTNEILMESIKHNTRNLNVTIEVGDPIDYKDRSRTLEEAYKHQFNL